MKRISRREMLATATAMGASLAWGRPIPWPSDLSPRERRDLYPQGVASGDPDAGSVVLWTRRPPAGDSTAATLTVEVATDPAFRRVVATVKAPLSAGDDWTARVLAAGLHPSQEYWYRFIDEHGFASRVGRTLTAPGIDDERAVRFAFISCQNVQQGAQNAYRRMIWEDEQRASADRLNFVMHLGDFVYEIVWYPEDRPQGMYDRRLRDIVRYANGEKHADFHVPTTVDDYRALYRGYLTDPDLMDARARWPFVCMWDNHEFSWKGWQTQENFGHGVVPAQTRKVAAAQAWFEYQPARIVLPGGRMLESYVPPKVTDTPLTVFDDNGLGQEHGNLAVLESLVLYRTQRWGKHVDLILTDNRTFRSQPITDQPDVKPFAPAKFPYFLPQQAVEILDAGRSYNGGHPPETITFAGANLPNSRRDGAPSSMLGGKQKAWFFERLRTSTARWKLWGNTVSMLDWRADLANVPPETGVVWPADGYGQIGNDDWAEFRTERAEILERVREMGITGFSSLAGDRHAFFAGLLSRDLPPKPFEPVAVEFVTGSISAPTIFESAAYNVSKDDPLRPLYLYDPGGGAPLACALNVTLKHGVRSSFVLQRTHDVQQALAASNPDVAPHLDLADLGGHGYCLVRATAEALEVECVAIPRPIERSDAPDGGPLAYRCAYRVPWWDRGAAPTLTRTSHEGALPLVL
jgi:alkaline phosphatase D